MLSVSACSGALPIVTATAPVAPVLAIVMIRSRRVMATSVLFLYGGSFFVGQLAVRHDALGPGFLTALEALRRDPRCASNRARNRPDQHGCARFDLARAAVNWRIGVRGSR